MIRPTKYCELEITLATGVRIAGRFHVDASTSSTIRPSDALRTIPGEYLLVSQAVITEGEAVLERQAILLRTGAIAYIALPHATWQQEQSL